MSEIAWCCYEKQGSTLSFHPKLRIPTDHLFRENHRAEFVWLSSERTSNSRQFADFNMEVSHLLMERFHAVLHGVSSVASYYFRLLTNV